MKEFAELIIDYLEGLKVDYADVRIVETREESIRVEVGELTSISSSTSLGFGVRVLKNGRWGFASSHDLSVKEAHRVAREAYEIALSSSLIPGRDISLSEEEIYVGEYKTPIVEDPFKISLEEKIGLLLRIDEVLRRDSKVKETLSELSFTHMKKYFASTEGARICQEIYYSGGGYRVTVSSNGEVQRRSYPADFGNYSTAGYEFIRSMRLLEEAERIREEALALLKAPPAPEGEMDLILGTHQLAMQIHESIGHAVEFDRILGYETSYAGRSFLSIDKLGKFKYGSPLLNVVQDATTPGGLGTFGYDDEGVKAQRRYIIKEGILKGFLTSRETAVQIGERSSGTMRAESWSYMPLIRMTNINLEPGEWTLEEIIEDTRDGILMDFNRSWSIDQWRLNFQFGTEIAWRVRRGKVGEILKNAIYTGITPKFWASMDRVASREYWRLWGFPNCGKGEPGQLAQVGHGTPPARFRKVKVGSLKR